MKRILQQIPLFLFLQPVFFVLHGLKENFGYINGKDCLLLAITYCGSAALLYFAFYPFFKNYIKAALIASFLMAFYFYFGAMHDFLKLHALFLSKYSVLISLFLLCFVLFYIVLKKAKQPLYRSTLFFNVLFLVYLCMDTSGIIWKQTHPNPDKLSVYDFAKKNPYTFCKCPKPDIYFLLFDEYASSLSLKKQYNYDNNGLDSFLIGQGFHIQAASHSNYKYTIYSMASMLNMSYLNGLSHTRGTLDEALYVIHLIKQNELIKFLSFQGYDINNYSVFDMEGNPSPINQSLLPLKTRLITEQTFLSEAIKDIGWILFQHFDDPFSDKIVYNDMYNNDKLINKVKEASAVKTDHPRFIYGHFYMPHPPYYYDKNGKRKNIPHAYIPSDENDYKQYLDYLNYTNTRIKEIINTIQTNTDREAIILFMGDHGFRYKDTTGYSPINHYQNQNAVYFPTKDYHLLYDSISGVNQFRAILNTLFKQQIPMLKDSVVDLDLIK